MGGLVQKAPYLSLIFVIAGLGALGMPGTMGFVGELTILISAVKSQGVFLAIIAVGSILGASYMIWTFRRVVYANTSSTIESTNFNMPKIEFFSLVVYIFLILFFGLYPQAIFDITNQAFNQLGGAL